jgi:hypothetical protein
MCLSNKRRLHACMPGKVEGASPEDDSRACGKRSSNTVPDETGACEDDGAKEAYARTVT